MEDVRIEGPSLVIGQKAYPFLDSSGNPATEALSALREHIKSALQSHASDITASSGRLFSAEFDGPQGDGFRMAWNIRNLMLLVTVLMALLNITKLLKFDMALLGIPAGLMMLAHFGAAFTSPKGLMLFVRWQLPGQSLLLNGIGRPRAYELRHIKQAGFDIAQSSIRLNIVMASGEKAVLPSSKLSDLLPIYGRIIAQRPDLIAE